MTNPSGADHGSIRQDARRRVVESDGGGCEGGWDDGGPGAVRSHTWTHRHCTATFKGSDYDPGVPGGDAKARWLSGRLGTRPSTEVSCRRMRPLPSRTGAYEPDGVKYNPKGQVRGGPPASNPNPLNPNLNIFLDFFLDLLLRTFFSSS